jgi:hypothetical protein
MLRITIYATLIVILTMGAASAQNDLKDIQAGENSWRTEQEKKNDRTIDRSYQSTIKILQDAKKRNPIRGPMSGPLHQRLLPRTSNNG